jgi:hypothetical protein
MADSDSFDGRVPLLGQLAGEGWFMGMGEVAATKSLTWLASDPGLRAALLAHLGTRAGINLSSVERLVPESVHDDRSRPTSRCSMQTATPSLLSRRSSART